ncbi:NUDIX hydrolase [Gorillibacterium sp. sgz5001074]|uniref:NUDIX hydrolase n=1 Tax=Gorillibacterium sp. sgz5001074 TaxID=3446695 RepID=UPI003F67DDB1
MSNEERFDIFDRNQNPAGTASRGRVHREGLWHRTFHCWVVTPPGPSGRSLLFQLRHPDKDTYPGKLDVSCGGHLLAGETVEDGVRELQEELGLEVTAEELNSCGVIAVEGFLENGLIDREFNHIHLMESPLPPGSFSFQTSEISGLFHVKLEEYRELVYGARAFLLAEGVELDKSGCSKHPYIRKVQLADFVPKPAPYLSLLFQGLDSMEAR